MIHPKIGPEPALRERCKGYTQYNIIHDKRTYTFTCNKIGNVIICHPSFASFKNRHIIFLEKYCKEKGQELKLVASEEKEIWRI